MSTNPNQRIVYVYPPQAKYSGMCIAGFILSFLCILLPFIFCLIGIGECNKYHYRGIGLGIAGLTITIIKAAYIGFYILMSI